MEENLRQRGNPKGATSATVATNVNRVRRSRETDLKGLSSALRDAGWPISVAALSRMENGERRVDVDDLMALSVALGVSPLDLLIPGEPVGASIGTALPAFVLPEEARAWGRGETTLHPEALVTYWQRNVVLADDELRNYERMRREADEPKARAWADRNARKIQAQRDAAVSRIHELESLLGDDDE